MTAQLIKYFFHITTWERLIKNFLSLKSLNVAKKKSSLVLESLNFRTKEGKMLWSNGIIVRLSNLNSSNSCKNIKNFSRKLITLKILDKPTHYHIKIDK